MTIMERKQLLLDELRKAFARARVRILTFTRLLELMPLIQFVRIMDDRCFIAKQNLCWTNEDCIGYLLDQFEIPYCQRVVAKWDVEAMMQREKVGAV